MIPLSLFKIVSINYNTLYVVFEVVSGFFNFVFVFVASFSIFDILSMNVIIDFIFVVDIFSVDRSKYFAKGLLVEWFLFVSIRYQLILSLIGIWYLKCIWYFLLLLWSCIILNLSSYCVLILFEFDSSYCVLILFQFKLLRLDFDCELDLSYCFLIFFDSSYCVLILCSVSFILLSDGSW